MAKFIDLKGTIKDAGDIKTVWQAIPDFKVGTVSLPDFIALHDETDALHKDSEKRSVELTGVKGNRNDKVWQLNELITRFRSGVRSAYGPDSPLYEQAGGTRTSSRKSPVRKGAGKTSAAVVVSTPEKQV